MHTGDILFALYLGIAYALNLIDSNKIIKRLAMWTKDIPVSVLNSASNEIVEKYILKSIRPEMIPEMQFHSEHGAKLVILSSALESICEPVAKFLKMDDIICTHLESNNGILTGKPIGNFCFGHEKQVQLEKYCHQQNFDLQTAFYYADSISDYDALLMVGNPVCVNPDSKLNKIAQAKKWSIKHWH